MNLMVIWRILLGAYEILLFLYATKHCNNYAENIRRQDIKFSYLGDQAPWVCTPL